MSIRVDTDAANKFSFRKRRERLDWRTLGSIQVEAVINNADVSLLQEILDNVAFCDLEYEDLRSVDRSFVKLFRLAQLIIEYLLFCQSTLVGVNKNLESEKTNLQQALADAQSGLKSKDSEVLALKKQLRSLQKVNQTYQLMAKASPGSDQRPAISVQKPTNSSQYERCPYCRKVFCTFGYLESHIRRRHPAEHVPYPCNPRREEGELPGSFFRILEVLGERLVDKLTANSTDTTKKDLELIRSTIEQTIVNQQSVQKDKLNLDRQIQELKSQIHLELEEERRILQDERKVIENMRHRLQEIPPASNIGRIEDDDDTVESAESAESHETRERALEELVAKKLEEKNSEIKKALEAMQDREMSRLRDDLAKEYDRDYRNLTSQITDANLQIQRLQSLLMQEQAKTVELTQKIVQTKQPPLEREPARKPEAVRQPSFVEKPSETASPPPFPQKQPSQLRLEIPAQPSEPESEISTSSQPSKVTRPPNWQDCLAFLEAHTEISLENTPWCTSLLLHSEEDFRKKRHNLKGQVRNEYQSLGINEKIDEAEMEAVLKMVEEWKRDHGANPNHKRMRKSLENDVALIMEQFFYEPEVPKDERLARPLVLSKSAKSPERPGAETPVVNEKLGSLINLHAERANLPADDNGPDGQPELHDDCEQQHPTHLRPAKPPKLSIRIPHSKKTPAYPLSSPLKRRAFAQQQRQTQVAQSHRREQSDDASQAYTEESGDSHEPGVDSASRRGYQQDRESESEQEHEPEPVPEPGLTPKTKRSPIAGLRARFSETLSRAKRGRRSSSQSPERVQKVTESQDHSHDDDQGHGDGHKSHSRRSSASWQFWKSSPNESKPSKAGKERGTKGRASMDSGLEPRGGDREHDRSDTHSIGSGSTASSEGPSPIKPRGASPSNQRSSRMSVFTQGIKSALTKMGHRRSRSSRSDATSAADHAERETAVHDIDNYPDEEHSVEQSPAVSASSSPQPHAREYGRRGNDDDSDNDGDDNNDNCGGRDRSSPPPQRLAPRDTYGNSRAESDSLRPSSARGLPLGLRDFQQHSTNTITEVSEETTDSASWPRQPKSMFSGASKSRQPAASTNGSTTPQPTPGRGTSASIVKGAPQTNVVQVAPGNTRPASRGGRSTQGTGDDMNSFDVTELSEISASLEITSFSDMENADLVQKFKANVQPPSSDEDATARDRGGRGGTAPGSSGGNGWTDRSPGPERKASSAPAPAVSRPAVIRVAANQSDDESPWDDDEEPTRSQRQPEREADSKPRGSTTAAQQPRLAEEDEFDFDDSELDMEHA